MTAAADMAVRAEAAAWLARLRSDARTPADEAAFQAWLGESARHRQAFDAVTAVFEAAGAVAGPADYETTEPVRHADRRKVLAGGAGLVLAGLAGAAVWRATAAERFSTRVGEQRRLALADGSQIILDTNSRLKIDFTRDRRRLELLSGRAHFDVAKDPARPFIVRFGEREVVALGTAFDISQNDATASVVLVEGRVLVRPSGPARDGLSSRPMVAGERLVFRSRAAPVRQDRPDISRETAWQSGRAVFENDTLQAAAAEINRYTRRPIVLADAETAALRVSGVYRTGDPEAFARSVALILPVAVDPGDDRIVLRARPKAAMS